MHFPNLWNFARLQQQINSWLILVFPLPIKTRTNDPLILKYLFNKSLVVINKIKYPSQHLEKTQLEHKVHSCIKTFCSKAVGSGSSTTSCLYAPNSWVTHVATHELVGCLVGWFWAWSLEDALEACYELWPSFRWTLTQLMQVFTLVIPMMRISWNW